MQTQYKRLTDIERECSIQWEVIKKHLPIQRKRLYNLRDIVDGILWVLRIGNQWRNMPECFPTLAKPIQPKGCGRLVSITISAGGRGMRHWKS